MRLFELMMDRFCDTNLMEMAFQRKQARTHALMLSDQIAQHMLKTLMFGECNNREHWCSEVTVWLRSIQRHVVKGTHRPLPRVVLLQILHEGPFETIQQVQKRMNSLSHDYPAHSISEPDAAVIHKKLLDIYSAICLDVSQEKFISVEDYLTKL